MLLLLISLLCISKCIIADFTNEKERCDKYLGNYGSPTYMKTMECLKNAAPFGKVDTESQLKGVLCLRLRKQINLEDCPCGFELMTKIQEQCVPRATINDLQHLLSCDKQPAIRFLKFFCAEIYDSNEQTTCKDVLSSVECHAAAYAQGINCRESFKRKTLDEFELDYGAKKPKLVELCTSDDVKKMFDAAEAQSQQADEMQAAPVSRLSVGGRQIAEKKCRAIMLPHYEISPYECFAARGIHGAEGYLNITNDEILHFSKIELGFAGIAHICRMPDDDYKFCAACAQADYNRAKSLLCVGEDLSAPMHSIIGFMHKHEYALGAIYERCKNVNNGKSMCDHVHAAFKCLQHEVKQIDKDAGFALYTFFHESVEFETIHPVIAAMLPNTETCFESGTFTPPPNPKKNFVNHKKNSSSNNTTEQWIYAMNFTTLHVIFAGLVLLLLAGCYIGSICFICCCVVFMHQRALCQRQEITLREEIRRSKSRRRSRSNLSCSE